MNKLQDTTEKSKPMYLMKYEPMITLSHSLQRDITEKNGFIIICRGAELLKKKNVFSNDYTRRNHLKGKIIQHKAST